MKTKVIYTVALIAIISFSNVNFGFSRNSLKVYNNVVELKEERSKVVSFYEGKNDINIQPTKQYKITFDAEKKPIEKILFQWSDKNKVWKQTAKYVYTYDVDGKANDLMYFNWNERTKEWEQDESISIYSLDISTELLSMNNL